MILLSDGLDLLLITWLITRSFLHSILLTTGLGLFHITCFTTGQGAAIPLLSRCNVKLVLSACDSSLLQLLVSLLDASFKSGTLLPESSLSSHLRLLRPCINATMNCSLSWNSVLFSCLFEDSRFFCL